jgi:3-oxoacyl-[acyl-carrier-protein] synthase II
MAAHLPSPPRIVVTGLGAVTNLGPDARSTWQAMREGRSGITPLEGEQFDQYPDAWAVKVAGQIKDFDCSRRFDTREAKRLDRFAQFGLYAAVEAVEHAGIDFGRGNPERYGVVVGSGVGGVSTIEEGHTVLMERGPTRLSPFTVPKLMVNASAGNISIRWGLQGPASAHATACASSGHAIGHAVEMMRRGHADAMVVGGSEAACTPLCIGAFQAMKALSTRGGGGGDPATASRPFDSGRDGFVLAEGGAMFVIETEAHAKARGAEIHAEIVGIGNSSDAGHITAPDAEGRGAARSMRWALEDGGLAPEQIDYINSHGTATPLGDSAEVAAVLGVFGAHARKSAGGKLLMSSTKSVHGHALGASGAVELVACIHAVRDGVAPPTINLDNPDPAFDIDLVPHEARERPIRYAMNNTFGFGGHNVTLLVGRYEG